MTKRASHAVFFPNEPESDHIFIRLAEVSHTIVTHEREIVKCTDS